MSVAAELSDDVAMGSTSILFDKLRELADAKGGTDKLRELILQLAVQGKLVPQDPDDEPAINFLERIKEHKSLLVEQGEIQKSKRLPAIEPDQIPLSTPASWVWTRLEDLCEVVTKGSSPKWQGVNYVEPNEDSILFITSQNVGNKKLLKLDSAKHVEAKFNTIEPRSILRSGDILTILVGSIGRSALWNQRDNANINQAVGIVRLLNGKPNIDPDFLLYFLNSPPAVEIMLGKRVIVAQPN